MVNRLTAAAAVILFAPLATAVPDRTAVYFEENRGQVDQAWSLLLRADQYLAGVSSNGVRIELPVAVSKASGEADVPPAISYELTTFDLEFVGARADAPLEAERPLGGMSNYFRARDPEAGIANVPHFAQARASDVYPGIDLVYRIADGKLRYDFEVEPGATPDPIALQFDGIERIEPAADGGLILHMPDRQIQHHAPEVYQLIGGRRVKIRAWYEIKDRFSVLFAMADYDADSKLIIDPTIEYSTYFGGVGHDALTDVSLSSAGDYVACGSTTSPGLATPGAPQPANAGNADIVVTRIAADGSGVLSTTYFGGSDEDSCTRIALDSNDNIVVAGYTLSADYPTPGGFDTTFGGALPGPFPQDGFVTKLAAAGDSVMFSTYVGGTDGSPGTFGRETIRGLRLDDSDDIYVVGNTAATDFPATNLLHGRDCGADDGSTGSPYISDTFLMKIAASGALDFASCFGGLARDAGRDLAFYDDGRILVVGHTRSSDYPVTAGAVNIGSTTVPLYSTFATILSADGSAIEASARVGGGDIDFAQSVMLDAQQRPVVGGSTFSDDLQVTPGAYQPLLGNITGPADFALISDGLLYRLSADLTTLEVATYFGGAGDDAISSVAVDDFGQIIAVISTTSYDLDTRSAFQQQKGGDIGGEFAGGTSDATCVGVSQGEPISDFAVFGRNGVNDLYELGEDDVVSYVGPLGTESADTRALAVGDINNDSFADVVAGNVGGPSHLYINDGTGSFLPAIAFGGPNPDLVSVAIGFIDGFSTLGVVVANDGAPNVYYPFSGGALGGAQIFDAAARASRDIAVFPAQPNIFVETVAPETVIIHETFAGGVAVDLRSVPGADLGDVAFGDVMGDGNADILLANGAGGALVIPREPSFATFSNTVLEVGAGTPGSVAVAEAGRLGIASAHADGLRYHRYDEIGGFFTTRQLLPTSDPARALAANPSAWLTAAGAENDRVFRVGGHDMYVAALDADASKILFGTYLGGAGEESGFYRGKLVATGDLVLASLSESDDYPLANPLQSTRAGSADGVLTRLSYPVDGDADGVSDLVDNCLLRPNADQYDSNGDGFGNACDPDMDNNGIVNVIDLGILKAAFFSTPGAGNWNPDADFDGNDAVNALDLGVLKLFFFQPPGPSAQ